MLVPPTSKKARFWHLLRMCRAFVVIAVPPKLTFKHRAPLLICVERTSLSVFSLRNRQPSNITRDLLKLRCKRVDFERKWRSLASRLISKQLQRMKVSSLGITSSKSKLVDRLRPSFLRFGRRLIAWWQFFVTFLQSSKNKPSIFGIQFKRSRKTFS